MIRNAIQRFMYGRYGTDQFNLALLAHICVSPGARENSPSPAAAAAPASRSEAESSPVRPPLGGLFRAFSPDFPFCFFEQYVILYFV